MAARAGVSPEYLSRLENDRATPTTRVLAKLAGALDQPVNAFFEPESPLEAADQCPVSIAGRCILDLMHHGRGSRPRKDPERYTPEQLETLRACNVLLHCGSPEVQRALSTVVRSLLHLHGAATI